MLSLLQTKLGGTRQQAHDAALSRVSVAGQEITIFEEASSLIAAMVEDIGRAQQRVWLEIYILMSDSAGQAIARALKERARAGVEVRLLYDSFGCLSTPRAFFDDLQAAGVIVHEFHGWWEALRRWPLARILNRRDHRKLLIVDDRVAYFGGMNILDHRGIQNVAEARAHGLPTSAGWRDIHVRLEGCQQQQVAQAFERLWRRVHRQRRLPWPRWQPEQMLERHKEGIYFFDNRPGFRQRSTARVFVPLIRRARRNLTVSMAYFLPVGRVLRELLRAARRGVRVRVIVPGESDVRLVQWATNHLYRRLLKHGIRIYERRGCMLHSKVMVVDDRWSIVGSANLDPRSLRLNLEFLAVIVSRPMATALKHICAFEMRRSQRVTLPACQRRRWWQRLRDRFAWSLRGWL